MEKEAGGYIRMDETWGKCEMMMFSPHVKSISPEKRPFPQTLEPPHIPFHTKEMSR